MNRVLFVSIAVSLSVVLSGSTFAQLAPRNPATRNPAPAAARATTSQIAPAAKPAAPPSYEVPRSNDPQEYVRFINRLLNFQPRTKEEADEYRKLAPRAMRIAAQQTLKVSKDSKSPEYAFASRYLVAIQLLTLDKADFKTKQQIYQRIAASLLAEQLDPDDLEMASGFAESLEQIGDNKLARQVYLNFSQVISRRETKSGLLTELAKSFEASARRLDLLGKPIQVVGLTTGGQQFDFSKYRGRVVLIDFWATWCSPCLAELPSLTKKYELYRSKGFEIVGICMDADPEKVTKHLQDRPLPWVNLHSGKKNEANPTAKYYGVNQLPTSILVDQRGNVVSLHARGEELDTQLARLLGSTARRN